MIEDKIYSRVCKECEEVYKTSCKFGTVCEECKERNHKIKVERTIFCVVK